ncbi:MAG: acyl-CoA desaturase [Bacteroidota bacterium]
MSSTEFKFPRFSHGTGRDGFLKDLRNNVNNYFKENGITPHANLQMKIKTIVIFSLYFAPYILIITGVVTSWPAILLCVLMGLAQAGIGMSIMHDACHDAYSSNKVINRILSYSINFIGGNRSNWIVQHNVKHHTYTNVFEADEDVDVGNIIRLSPYSKKLKIHRFQHIYSWFLYTLGTIGWLTYKDFHQALKYRPFKKNQKQSSFTFHITKVFLSKVFYYSYIVIIPVLVTDFTIGQVILGFLTIQMVTGLVLTVVFQLAHVVENTEHSSAPLTPVLEDSWAVHQVKTTNNFARKNKFLNWYLGGLNFQVEHHLFPNICHIHYNKISEIVKKTVHEYGLTYNEHPTFLQALQSHYRFLRTLGYSN